MTHPKTQSREIALQYLYMHDALAGQDVQPLSDYLGLLTPPPSIECADFARALVESVLSSREELDKEISASATNWTILRMAIVDRNILRLGLAELTTYPETPYRVIIDEAVELARRFSSEAACAFVNGVLDRLRVKHRPADEPAPPPPTPTPAP